MISILDENIEYYYTGNCIKITGSSDAYITTEEEFAFQDFIITDYLSIGNKMVFTFDDENGIEHELEFVAKDAAVLGQLDLPTEATSALTLPNYVDFLITYLEAHSILSAYFTFEKLTSPSLRVRATFNLKETFTGNGISDGGEIEEDTPTPTYIAPVFEENFRVVADIFHRNPIDNSYINIGSVTAVPDSDSVFVLEISSIIQDEFEAYLQQLSATEQNLIDISTDECLFYVRLFEIFGTPATIQNDYTYTFTYKSKFGKQSIKDYHNAPSPFIIDSNSAYWLTQRSGKSIVQPSQQEFLTYFKNFSNYILRIVFLRQDGVTEVINAISETNTNKFNTIQVGFNYLVDTYSVSSPDLVVAYDVFLLREDELGGLHVELEWNYQLDRNYYELIYDYYYLNRNGCLEVFRATGIHQGNLSIEREVSTANKCATPKLKGINQNVKNETIKTITARSGILLNNQDIEALIDFMNSDYTWLKLNDEFCPIQLIDKKYALPEDLTLIREFQFKYKLSNNSVD